jgi:glyoxylase-like metal-dependent hydrolase (beta-lactamase superfamily II)
MAEPRVVPVPCQFGQGATVYAYYIDAPQPALIDTGVAASPEAAIEPALNAIGRSLRDVKWILATHGHWDHIGGAHAARSRAADDVQVAIHGDDQELLSSRKAHVKAGGYQELRFRYLDDVEALGRQDAMLMENLSGELIADRELSGGERVDLGGDVVLEAIHTPGHSPGSVSFFLPQQGWLFTGDGVQVTGSASGGFPLYVEPRSYRATQQKLLDDVRPKRLHMGHRFRLADGTSLESVIDGPQVEAALRDGLALHERIEAALGNVGHIDLEQPKAVALRPLAEALGVAGDQPTAWPGAFFITVHGYLAAAAAAKA